jgi:hypothetical protein
MAPIRCGSDESGNFGISPRKFSSPRLQLRVRKINCVPLSKCTLPFADVIIETSCEMLSARRQPNSTVTVRIERFGCSLGMARLASRFETCGGSIGGAAVPHATHLNSMSGHWRPLRSSSYRSSRSRQIAGCRSPVGWPATEARVPLP